MPVLALPTAAVVGQSITAAKYNEGVTFLNDDSGWIAVTTFTNSWTAALPVFYRRRLGIVYLRGQMTGGSTGTAFTLPTGYLPAAANIYFGVWSSGTGTAVMTRVNIQSSGAVIAVSGGSPGLDAINFLADA